MAIPSRLSSPGDTDERSFFLSRVILACQPLLFGLILASRNEWNFAVGEWTSCCCDMHTTETLTLTFFGIFCISSHVRRRWSRSCKCHTLISEFFQTTHPSLIIVWSSVSLSSSSSPPGGVASVAQASATFPPRPVNHSKLFTNPFSPPRTIVARSHKTARTESARRRP